MKQIQLIGTLLDRIKELSKVIDNSHSYRWIKLVAISDLGEDCRYARASEKLWNLDQREQEISLLRELRADIDNLLSVIEQLDEK